MIKVKDGYAKLIGTTYSGSASRVLLSNGGDHVLGNASGNIPLNNGTVSTNLNADMLDGLHIHTGRNNEVNKVVRTDASGYIQAGWINTTSGDMGTTGITRIYCSDDGYIRYKTPANFFNILANDGNQISITVGSQNRKLTVNYANSAGTSSNVVVNSSDANSTYRMVWHSGNTLYGTNNIYCNPSADLIYSAGFRHVSYNSASYLLRSDGGAAGFHWSGQSGQPAWLWGGNSQHTYYVYNPSNFNVNSAAKLRVVSCYNGTTNNDLWSTIKSSNSSYLGTSTMYEVYNDGGPTTYGHVLDIVTVHSNHWQPQLWFDAGKGGRLRYRNKDYNNDTWGNWYAVAFTSDIPTVTDYYWANVKVSASSNAYTTPQFGKVTIYDGTNAILSLKTTTAGAYAYLAAYNTGGQYGADVVLHSGSAMVLGSGESAASMYDNNVDSLRGSENLYLTADTLVKIFTNCDSIGNRKHAATFTTDGYSFFHSYINIGGHEKNASSPSYVWGSNSTDNYLRSYQTSKLSVNYANSAGSASSSGYIWAGSVSNLNTPTTWSSDGTRLVYDVYSGSASNKPVSVDNANGLVTFFKSKHGTSNQYVSLFAFPDHNRFYFRYAAAGSWGSWQTVAFTSDIPNPANYYWANVKVSASSSTGTYPTFANMKSTGRIYAGEWIEFSGNTGLYWPNTYGAHFYPNNTSTYGQFQLLGTKNGYSGIHFGNTINYLTVMSTDTHHGLYCENYGWEFYFNRSNSYVGIRTSSTPYPVSMHGDSYTNGWSRAASGFYVEGTGVHYTSQGSVGEIDMSSNNEFLWGSNGSTLYFNYRAVSRGTTVTNYIWNAGSSSSYAAHTLGALTSRGDLSLFGLTQTCNKANDTSYMNSALQIREYNFGGAQSDTWAIAPRLSWHWSGRVQTLIGLASNGDLYLSKNQFASAYRLVYESGTWGINISGNADTVDGQHFNWNNNKNDHTYLWAASSSGLAYLVHRASMSVNYATYARYVYCTSGNYLNFQWSGQGGLPTWLFGSNDGANVYVWNPSNFSVNSAAVLRGNASNPDNSHPGHGAKVFYSWNTGQANNASSGYSNGITIGSHPNDTSYGFQIVQNMWDDRTYTRRYNGGWLSWKTLAWTSDIPNPANYYWANIRVSASSNTGTLPTFNTCWTSNWFRSTGTTGWYSESYGGGIHMLDSTWVRTYNGKSFYCSAVILAGNRIYTGYDSGEANSISCSNWFRSNGTSGWYNPTYGCHVYPNNINTYGGLVLRGTKNGYHGFVLGENTNYMNVMDNSNDKGLYQEGKSWILYYNRSNNRVGLLTSSLSGYAVTTGGDVYIKGGWIRTEGTTGWYNQSYGGGMYMEDSTWVRVHGGKKFYVNNSEYSAIHSAGGVYVAGAVHSYANYLKSTCNGKTITIGSANASYCHYLTDAPAHWFNTTVHVAGHVYGGTNYNRRLAYVDEIPGNTWRGIENVLTSTSTSNSLTANMGRVLANGASDRPIVLLAGTLYRSGASSSYTTWYFTGYRHRSISSSNPSVYINGGVARFYFTNASGYGFSFAQVCANHQASGEATGYQYGEYQTRSSGLFWFGTYASGLYLYIRAIALGDRDNDTAESYTGMWTNYSDGVTRVSIIAVGYAY